MLKARFMIPFALTFFCGQGLAERSEGDCKKWAFYPEGGFENEPVAALVCPDPDSETIHASLTIGCSDDIISIHYEPSYELPELVDQWISMDLTFQGPQEVEFRDWMVLEEGPGALALYRVIFYGEDNPFLDSLLNSNSLNIGPADTDTRDVLTLDGSKVAFTELSRRSCANIAQ